MKYLLLLTTLLAACNVPVPTPPAEPTPQSVEESEPIIKGEPVQKENSEDSEDFKEEEEMVTIQSGMYNEMAYSDESITQVALSDGNNSLLFFYASWCGTCQGKDKILKNMYGSEEFATSTYKVDYDTATELKARYGITTQDTFVLVDGEGNALQTVVGASESDLRSLLSS